MKRAYEKKYERRRKGGKNLSRGFDPRPGLGQVEKKLFESVKTGLNFAFFMEILCSVHIRKDHGDGAFRKETGLSLRRLSLPILEDPGLVERC